MTAVVDYGMGNLRSLYNALRYIGVEAEVTSSAGDIEKADRIVLPGVGAFGDAMEAIREHGLDEALRREALEKGKPMLGICLGMQLLAKSSDEHGFHEGLGWLDAEVVRFDGDAGVKIPHIGWNDIDYEEAEPFFAGLKKSERAFYFVHSHHMKCRDRALVLATCRYGAEFAAAVRKENIVAVQFHPEKSQDNGIQFLQNFFRWKPL